MLLTVLQGSTPGTSSQPQNPLQAMRNRFAAEEYVSEEPKSQLELYYASHNKADIDKAKDASGNFDILKYLSNKSEYKQFPAVIAAARAELSALATSCSSERTFSDAGKTLTPWRSTMMGIEKFRRTVFLKGNRQLMVSAKHLKSKYLAKYHKMKQVQKEGASE